MGRLCAIGVSAVFFLEKGLVRRRLGCGVLVVRPDERSVFEMSEKRKTFTPALSRGERGRTGKDRAVPCGESGAGAPGVPRDRACGESLVKSCRWFGDESRRAPLAPHSPGPARARRRTHGR